jgi:hypothetical protein
MPPVSIENLPAELLYLIFDDLTTNDLFRLSRLNRNLNYLALIFYMSRANIPDVSEGILYFHHFQKEDMDIIRCLQLAVFITSIKGLDCTFGGGLRRHALSSVHAVACLISRLSYLERVTVNYTGPPFSWYCSSYSMENGWYMALRHLLDALSGKGCTHFTLRGGDVSCMGPLDINILDAESLASLGAELEAIVDTSISRKLFDNLVEALDVLFCRTLKPLFYPLSKKRLANTIYQTSYNDARPRTGNLLSWMQPDFVPPRPLSSLISFTVCSSAFFHRPFLPWTIATLTRSSNSLTYLSLDLLALTAQGWNTLLSGLTFPSLSEFTVTSTKADFADLSAFLIRHDNITALNLASSEYKNKKARGADPFPQSMLYRMQKLCGRHDHISVLLDPGVVNKPRCPLLNYVLIQSFVSVPSSHVSSVPNFTPLDRALSMLALHRSGEVHLCLNMVDGVARYHHWFDVNKELESSRVERSLHCVTTLELSTGVDLLDQATLTLIPYWLSLFPAVSRVKLGGRFSRMTRNEKFAFVELVCDAWLTDLERRSRQPPFTQLGTSGNLYVMPRLQLEM